MVTITYTESFKKTFKKIKNKEVKQKIIKQIEKIIQDPSLGKPLSYGLKGERTVYIRPFRLIYAYRNDEIIILRFFHRGDVYTKK